MEEGNGEVISDGHCDEKTENRNEVKEARKRNFDQRRENVKE